jgi:hypothetical protein
MREKQGKEKENRLMNAEMGHVIAMISHALTLEKSDPERFVWLGNSAALGHYGIFLADLEVEMRDFNSETGHEKVVFAMGRALRGRINSEKQTIFGVCLF